MTYRVTTSTSRTEHGHIQTSILVELVARLWCVSIDGESWSDGKNVSRFAETARLAPADDALIPLISSRERQECAVVVLEEAPIPTLLA